MGEMTEEEIDAEIEEKMRRLTPRQRELIEELTSWNLDLTEEAYVDSQLKRAKHSLWQLIENQESFERLVQYIKDHSVCSLCGKKGCMLTKKDEQGDRMFICESCIIKNQTVDIMKVWKSDGTIVWEWKEYD